MFSVGPTRIQVYIFVFVGMCEFKYTCSLLLQSSCAYNMNSLPHVSQNHMFSNFMYLYLHVVTLQVLNVCNPLHCSSTTQNSQAKSSHGDGVLLMYMENIPASRIVRNFSTSFRMHQLHDMPRIVNWQSQYVPNIVSTKFVLKQILRTV